MCFCICTPVTHTLVVQFPYFHSIVPVQLLRVPCTYVKGCYIIYIGCLDTLTTESEVLFMHACTTVAASEQVCLACPPRMCCHALVLPSRSHSGWCSSTTSQLQHTELVYMPSMLFLIVSQAALFHREGRKGVACEISNVMHWYLVYRLYAVCVCVCVCVCMCVSVCVCVCVLSDIAQADLLCKLVKDSMSVEQATALWRYVLKF